MTDRFDGVPPAEESHPVVRASPYAWIEPGAIPPRQWLYGRHLVRRHVSCTIAPGGAGKSSLLIAEALAKVSGKPLLDVPVGRPLRVWLYNGEDDAEELQRRIAAACLHYGLTREDIGDRLFVDSGRDMPVVIARETKAGVTICAPVVEAFTATLKANRIDAWSVDPFVSSHAVSENDNGALDAVVKAWIRIADATDTAGELVHHARKTNGLEITVEDARGGSALIGAVRSARMLNPMTKDEAEKAGIEPTERRSYFRVSNGKRNLSPPSDASTWFRLLSVDLRNGRGDLDFGDSVGVVAPWTWPDAFDGMTTADLRKAQVAVSNGGPWRENAQAREWVGVPIAAALGLDPTSKTDRARIGRMLRAWIGTGMFVVVEGRDERSKPRHYVEVGALATATGD